MGRGAASEGLIQRRSASYERRFSARDRPYSTARIGCRRRGETVRCGERSDAPQAFARRSISRDERHVVSRPAPVTTRPTTKNSPRACAAMPQPTADSRLDLSARSHRRTRCGRANASRPATWRTSSHHGSSACVRSLMRQQLWQSKRKLRWICITLLLNKAYMPQGRFDRRRYAAILKS